MQFCRRTLCAIVDKPHCIEDVKVGKIGCVYMRTSCTIVHVDCESTGMIRMYVCMYVHYIGTHTCMFKCNIWLSLSLCHSLGQLPEIVTQRGRKNTQCILY